jgi:hypothetical protein
MFRRRKEFIEWEAYKKKIDFLDEFGFEQDCAKSFIKSSSAV